MKSAWMCPSRGRPENVERLIRAWVETGATSDLYVRVDDDDSKMEDYLKIINKFPFELYSFKFEILHGTRIRIGPVLNSLGPELAEIYSSVGFLGDDHVPRTSGWDSSLAFAVSGGGIAYGNDLLQGEALPTAVLMSSDIIRATDQFCPPHQLHLYLDNYWLDLGKELGRIVYLPEVIIEHMHPGIGKASSDAVYGEVNSLDAVDKEAYELYKKIKFYEDVEKVNALWQK